MKIENDEDVIRRRCKIGEEKKMIQIRYEKKIKRLF